uniref:YjeF N-terminal domain-containing protein n=1 Tax=Cyprinus carpio TaxID=7962 RepID=A0A8C2FAJ8_CYPCA
MSSGTVESSVTGITIDLDHRSKEEAVAMETELLRDYHFGRQQLTEILGNACATAITKVFPLWSLEKRQPTVLVVCGPDQNGCVGLACARHLRVFEYIPTVFTPKRSSDSLHQDLMVQCERMDLPFLSYLPTEVRSDFSEPNSDIKRASRGNLGHHLQKPRAATRIHTQKQN